MLQLSLVVDEVVLWIGFHIYGLTLVSTHNLHILRKVSNNELLW